ADRGALARRRRRTGYRQSPSAVQPSRPKKLLFRPARDRRYEQHLIAVLERIRSAPQKPNILLIHINIQETPRLAGFVPQMGLQFGELLVELREQLIEVSRRAYHARCPRSQPPQSGRNLNRNAHEKPPGPQARIKMRHLSN